MLLLRSLALAWLLALTQGWAICSVEEKGSDWMGDGLDFWMFLAASKIFQNAVACCSYCAAGMRSTNEEPKQADVTLKVGSSLGSFLEEDVGNELDQSGKPLTKVAMILLGCEVTALHERVNKIFRMWNFAILVTFGAFVVSSICLCMRASGMVGKAIGSITLLIALACLLSPAVFGIMISKALTQYCDGLRSQYKKIDGPLPCYINIQGIFSLGATLMAVVTGALLIKPSVAEAKGTESSSG